MTKSVFAYVSMLAALSAFAAGMTLKPGLWEVKLLKQVSDGRDMSDQMSGANSTMQQALSKLPPEQRARVQAMLAKNGAGFGGNGGYRLCVSPEMAKRDTAFVGKEGNCQPATVTRSGNVATYAFSCTSNGTTREGKGQATSVGDVITNQMDLTTRAASGPTHVMHIETELHYVGPDCGDLKPPDAASVKLRDGPNVKPSDAPK
jgi:Protein of unknown function (DUF3617)